MAADTVWVGIRQTASTATILALITALTAIVASLLTAILSLGREKRMLRLRLRYDAYREVSRQLDNIRSSLGPLITKVCILGTDWMPTRNSKQGADNEASPDTASEPGDAYFRDEETMSLALHKHEIQVAGLALLKAFMSHDALLADMRQGLAALNESSVRLHTALDDLETTLREFADGKATSKEVVDGRSKALTVLFRYDSHLLQFAWALQRLAVGEVTKHRRPLDLFTTSDPEEPVLTKDGFVAAKRTEFFNPSRKNPR
jgi:hypothetical protein